MIKPSKRLKNIFRIKDNFRVYQNKIRLNRNEDPSGWDNKVLNKFLKTIKYEDFSFYKDSLELEKKISKKYSVKCNQVLITSGADGAIKKVFETFIDYKDKVLILDPSWPMYEVYSNIFNAKIIKKNFKEDLSLNIENICTEILNKNIRLFILANPNMPTGTIVDNNDILKIIKVCAKRNTLVLIDEAYHLFYKSSQLKQVNKFKNLIFVRTFSKAFGLASLRIGYIITNENFVRNMNKLRSVTNSNGFAIKAAEFIFNNYGYFEKRVEKYIKGREYIYEKLNLNNIISSKSYANFLLIKCKDNKNANMLIKKIEKKGYLIKGPYKDKILKNYVRVTTGPLKLMKLFWRDCYKEITYCSKKK
tara:strand:+ start:4007 stop:5092 length:1086 start_codon:yes stop_codon:yes gene_type:complete